jgi:hypothetical protein
VSHPIRKFTQLPSWYGGRGSSVSSVTRLRAGRPGLDSLPGQECLLIATASRPVLGPTQPYIQWVPGTLSPGVKRPGREDDHLPPSSAEVKNTCSYTSTCPCVFMAWYLKLRTGTILPSPTSEYDYLSLQCSTYVLKEFQIS